MLAALLALAVTMPLAPSRAQVTWDAYTYMTNSQVVAARNLKLLVDQINEQAAGALVIKLHLGGTLTINAGNISAAVADDVIQIADDTQYLGNVPIGGILRLPFLVQDTAQYERAYRLLQPYIDADFAKKGITVLARYAYPLQVVWSRNEMRRLSDIKGQKIRVTSPEQGEFIKRFGGIPITLGTAEVPAALDRGIISGVLTASSGAGYTWRDLLKYNYRLGPNYSDSLIVVNSIRFAALPPDTQAKIREIAGRIAPATGTQMQQEEDNLTQKMQAEGLIVTPPLAADAAEGRSRMAPYWEEWAKAHGPRAVEALRGVREALKE